MRQFVACNIKEDLHSYEVPFKYEEDGVRKMELVKVRTCVECSKRMFYKKLSLETEKQQQQEEAISSKKRKSEKMNATSDSSTASVVEDEVIEVPKPKGIQKEVIDLSTLENSK